MKREPEAHHPPSLLRKKIKMNTLTPFAPSLSKTIRRTSASQLGNARSLAPSIKAKSETRVKLSLVEAERLLTQATTSKPIAFALPSIRGRATRQQIESALLSLLFVSIAITFGFLMTA